MSKHKSTQKQERSRHLDLDTKMRESRFNNIRFRLSDTRSRISMVKSPLHWITMCGPLFFHANDTSLKQVLFYNKFFLLRNEEVALGSPSSHISQHIKNIYDNKNSWHQEIDKHCRRHLHLHFQATRENGQKDATLHNWQMLLFAEFLIVHRRIGRILSHTLTNMTSTSCKITCTIWHHVFIFIFCGRKKTRKSRNWWIHLVFSAHRNFMAENDKIQCQTFSQTWRMTN